MRLHFAIYLAAGLTLFFAVLSVCAHFGEAFVTQNAIRTLQPVGDDLSAMLSVRSEHYRSAIQALLLAGLQGMILFCAWKWRRQCPVPGTE
jgi:hypothetical protein